MQALWFEQLVAGPLTTEDGRSFEIIQPGFWNHGKGPDFTHAAIRWLPVSASDQPTALSDIVVGSVEIHLRASDWMAHHHQNDPAYSNTILHVIWEASSRPVYPATADFKSIPQFVFSKHLAAPFPALLPILQAYAPSAQLPESKPGRCQAQMASLPIEKLLEIIQSAGLFRLTQRAQRWHWRAKLTSPEQALFEALAEALGFHANQIPMRLLAQRLPYAVLRPLPISQRMALLFGISSFLPAETTRNLPQPSQEWLRPLWEIWWKQRVKYLQATLPRSQWQLAGLRPLNRPERRIAALAHLPTIIPQLVRALEAANVTLIEKLLLKLDDPFWIHRATLSSQPLASPTRLIGSDRLENILTNVIWPLVALKSPSIAEHALAELPVAENRHSRIATQRVLGDLLPPKRRRTALTQQGLLQIYRDYCLTDCSACARCTFPEAIAAVYE